jgi:hypothetical protein
MPELKETNPNKVEVKFWLGESWEDFGFTLTSADKGYNGNLPALYSKGPDGREWRFNGPIHHWEEIGR